jgi:hypothetical protein
MGREVGLQEALVGMEIGSRLCALALLHLLGASAANKEQAQSADRTRVVSRSSLGAFDRGYIDRNNGSLHNEGVV